MLRVSQIHFIPAASGFLTLRDMSYLLHIYTAPGKFKRLKPSWKQFFSSKKVFVVPCLLQVGRQSCLTQLSPSVKAKHHCTRAVRHPPRRSVSDVSSDPMEAELLQLKKQLSTYCGCLKNLFLSRSHYKNQSCHTSPEYEKILQIPL